MTFRRFVVATALAAAATVSSTCGTLAQSASSALEGSLLVRWGDPRPGRAGGDLRFAIARPDGSVTPLTVAPADRASAIGAFGKTVRVETRDAQPTVAGAPVVAEKITVLEAEREALQPTAVTKRVLFILLRYKGDAQAPHSAEFFDALANPLMPNSALKIPATINGFFSVTSYKKLLWNADVAGVGGLAATGWLTLPRTKAQYANCGWSDVCADLDLIANDAMKLAKAQGVDVSSYDNVNLVLNNDLDCCAWGGGFVFENKVYGATWEPPWGQETSTYVHEMGHSLGLPHSGWVYYAYDSPWDEMSSGSTANALACGSYKSANSANATQTLTCRAPGGGYISAHKDKLGWIPSANKLVVNSISTQTVALEAEAAPLGSRLKMIKICLGSEPCSGSTAHYLTVEARVKTHAYDKGLPGEGIIIHDFRANRAPRGVGNACFFNTTSGWAVPVDATAKDYRGAPDCDSGGRIYPKYALFNAQYPVGKFYNSTTYGIRVEVLSRSGSVFNVKVTRSK
jgi:M6 family metalloprotease-like protein